jgi:hypothetical protein
MPERVQFISMLPSHHDENGVQALPLVVEPVDPEDPDPFFPPLIPVEVTDAPVDAPLVPLDGEAPFWGAHPSAHTTPSQAKFRMAQSTIERGESL